MDEWNRQVAGTQELTAQAKARNLSEVDLKQQFEICNL